MSQKQEIEWIKLSDQLPPEPDLHTSNSYLCTVGNHIVILRYRKTIIRGKIIIRWQDEDVIFRSEPIAWAYLPEPFKDESEENKPK